MRLVRVGFAFVAMIMSAVAAPGVWAAGNGVAAAAPATCAPLPPPSGGIITLTADCDTTVSLMIPNGVTLNGAGHTITAHDPTGGNFSGAVLTNAGTSMTIENLTIKGTGFATDCAVAGLYGIFFNNASGSVSGVTVQDITQHSGCPLGWSLRANATMGTARTVTITNMVATGYQKSALVASGMMTMNVSASTLGPPDRTTPALLPSQNGVQYGGSGVNVGAGGTMTTSTIDGSGFGNASDQGTAVLLFGAKNVTLSNDTITGAGTDIGVAVSTDTFDTPNVPSTGIVISHNQIGRTSADSPDSVGVGVDVDPSAATLICNTFSGWKTNIVGAVQGPCITTTTLPAGAECQAYSAQLTAQGSAPFTWSVISGSLPPGLTLSKNGAITGTALIAGNFQFTVRVVDATGLTATQAQIIAIHSDCAPAASGVPTWTHRPGCAVDISVGQAGQIWVVGCNEVPAGLGIWRWNGAGWVARSGGAVTIAADQSVSGNAWVTNDSNAIWRGNGYAWGQLPGFANNIAVGANGSAWVVGTNQVPAGFGIWRWNGAGWVPQPGGALTIAVDPSGNAWVTNDAGGIWRWNGHAWVQLPGCAVDISIGQNGQVWVVGCNRVFGGLGIWRWNGAGWVPQSGGAVTIAVDPSGNHPWVTNENGDIFSS